QDVFRKIRKDFDDKGVKVSDAELRKALEDTLATAMAQLEAEASKA
ncbi:ATPase inhibitor subunit zeta, partial [Acinetobacter baumannii]